MKTLPIVLSTATVLALAVGGFAQFTPGSGGTYTPPRIVPAPAPPAPPAGPTAPTAPRYPWEVPDYPTSPYTPAPAPSSSYPLVPNTTSILPPAPAETVRIVQPVLLPRLSDAQLADLTASIALYPDPLLAEMFPATTNIEELAYADRWLEQHPGAGDRIIGALPLDDSVRSMMHYPSVLNMLTDHLDWAQSLGLAFSYQRGDLFDAIQRWRATAVACGYLYSNDQQDVLRQGTMILIQPPPRTQVVYVPVYDPAVVYVRPRPQQPVPRNVITFSTGGFSLSFVANDLDWHGREVRIPRRDDRDGRGGDGRGGDGRGDGRGGAGRGSDNRTTFVPSNLKPNQAYPTRVQTPQPDKKVVTLPPPNAPAAPGRGSTPARDNTPPRDTTPPRSGGLDNNPNTPW